MQYISSFFGGKPNTYNLTDQNIFDYIKNTTVFAPSTKTIYLNKLSIIRNDFFGSQKTLLWVLLHPREFYESLIKYSRVNQLKPATMTQFVSIMISIITHHLELQDQYPDMIKQWKKLKMEVEQPVNDQYDSNQPTEKQKNAFFDFEQLLKIKDSLPKGSNERLLISLYTLIPAQRSNFDKVKIYGTDPKIKTDNYIVWNNKPYIVLNKYKTSRIYDTITINIPPELQQEILYSLELNPREYLFVKKNGLPYDKSSSFNQYANRILKKVLNNEDFNLTMFRHIYISRPDIDVNNLTVGEKRKLANSMGHSPMVQNKYLFKE